MNFEFGDSHHIACAMNLVPAVILPKFDGGEIGWAATSSLRRFIPTGAPAPGEGEILLITRAWNQTSLPPAFRQS